MNIKEKRERFILDDEPDRIKKEYRGDILNIHHNACDEKPILFDGKPKQKTLNRYYKRNKQF